MEEITIQQFFEQFPMINISKFAEYCGINTSQMRQYAKCLREPSNKTKLLMQLRINKLAIELKGLNYL
jgi:hypothetical protein